MAAERRKLHEGLASIKASLDDKYFSAEQYGTLRLALVAKLRVAYETIPSEASGIHKHLAELKADEEAGHLGQRVCEIRRAALVERLHASYSASGPAVPASATSQATARADDTATVRPSKRPKKKQPKKNKRSRHMGMACFTKFPGWNMVIGQTAGEARGDYVAENLKSQKRTKINITDPSVVFMSPAPASPVAKFVCLKCDRRFPLVIPIDIEINVPSVYEAR